MDPTTTPTDETVVEAPPGQSHAYGLNMKMLVDETVKDLAELRDKYEAQALQVLTDAHQLALKTQTDAQSAANVHLLNVISTAQKVSESSVLHLATVAANEEEEQATGANVTIDDIGKVMQTMTDQLNKTLTSGLMAILQALTGRPPVTAPAVEGTATKLGTT
jgi:hypothetical protein